MYNNFYITLLFLLIFFFSCNVITEKNPINSLLSLICCFVLVSLFLCFFELNFFAIIIITIYIGAIAIFFLFIIMFINIKKRKFYNKSYIYIILIMFFFFFKKKILFFFFQTNLSLDILCFICYKYSLEILSFFLYNYLSFLIIYSGLILFIAMLGVVYLLIDFK